MRVLLLFVGIVLSLIASGISGDYISTTVNRNGKVISLYNETTFSSDGMLYFMSMPAGSWKEDTATNSLVIKSIYGSGRDEINKILKNKNGELILEDENKIVIKYIKIDKKKLFKYNKKAPFLGKWHINNNKSISESFILELPNLFFYIKKNKKENSVEKMEGTWYYFPKKKTLIISSFSNPIQGKNIIKKVTRTNLVLKNDKKEIKAVKK
jgi:hypothetical protein